MKEDSKKDKKDSSCDRCLFECRKVPPPRHAIWISTSRYTHGAVGFRSACSGGAWTRGDTLVHPPVTGTCLHVHFYLSFYQLSYSDGHNCPVHPSAQLINPHPPMNRLLYTIIAHYNTLPATPTPITPAKHFKFEIFHSSQPPSHHIQPRLPT